MDIKYKQIFIDLDDTIWDFRANSKESLRDLFFSEMDELIPYKENFDLFFRHYVQRNQELWTQYGLGQITKEYLSVERFLSPLRAIEAKNIEELAEKMNATYLARLATKSALIPHSREFLDFCVEKNLPMTIISNGFEEVQYRKMRSAGIEHYFEHIILSDKAGALKPSKAIFEHALKINDARKEEVLMIGDSFEADIMGAANTGIDAIYFNRNNRQPELPERVWMIDDFRDIYKFMER